MRGRRRWTTLGLAAAVLVGCGAGARVSEDEFAGELASTFCGLVYECGCDTPGFASEAECVEQARMSAQEALDEAAALGLEYNPSCGAAEVGRFADLGCSTAFDALEPTSACPCKLFFGEQQRGEPCELLANGYDDCGRELECRADPEGIEPGETCQELCPYLKGGALCYDIPSQTSYGTCNYEQLLYCDTEETGTCRPLGLIGEPCPCAPWAFCDVESPFGPVCVGLRGEGESCAVGQGQGLFFGGDICGEDLYCSGSVGLVEPVCVSLPGEGESCRFEGCRGALFCNDVEVCVAPGMSGAPCEGDYQCAEGYFCDESIDPSAPSCAPLPGEGQPCASFDECAPGLVCNPFDDVCEPAEALVCFGG